jgi:hypothetical protein
MINLLDNVIHGFISQISRWIIFSKNSSVKSICWIISPMLHQSIQSVGLCNPWIHQLNQFAGLLCPWIHQSNQSVGLYIVSMDFISQIYLLDYFIYGFISQINPSLNINNQKNPYNLSAKMAIPIFLLNKNLANDSLTLVTGTCYRAGRYHFPTSREFPAYKSKYVLEVILKKQNEIVDSNNKFTYKRSCCMLYRYLLTAMSQQTNLQSSPAEISLKKLIVSWNNTNTDSILDIQSLH